MKQYYYGEWHDEGTGPFCAAKFPHAAGSNGAAFLMQALSRNPRYATEAELNDSRIWSKV